MSMQIDNYQSFYISTEPITMTGSGGLGLHKDTLVKYEFNTTDQNGNKIMDKLSRAETMELLNDVSRQYGDNVIVEFSGDALALIQGDIKGKYAEMNEEAIKKMEEKSALLQEAVEPGQDLHRLIGNIRTNRMLEESLEGMGKNIVKAAWSIIDTDLLPHHIGSMTEEQRQELISLGMEKAKYIAKDMGEQGALFLEAMEQIAKYGMNGKTDESGKVTYNIQWGPPIGAPDDYISTSDLMQKLDPQKWRKYLAMWRIAVRTKDRELERKAFRYIDDWENYAYQNRKQEVFAIKSEYASWKKQIQNTKLKKIYVNADQTDIDSFQNSIQGQSKTLDDDYLRKNLEKFNAILSKEYEQE